VFGGDLAMKVVNVTTPGAQSLFTSLKVPGSALGVEIVEYQGVERRPVQPRPQDPGAAILTLTVRDLDGIVARARQAGIRVSTTGGAPVVVPGGTRVIVMQDPDGFFVALVQPSVVPETTASASSNVVASGFDVVVGDMDLTARLYREALGFQMRIPGTAVLQLLVRDVKAATSAWKKAGGEVISTGGEPVTMGALTLVVLRDPNNLMLELIPRRSHILHAHGPRRHGGAE